MSSSRVLTPIDRALVKAGTVFSGIRPRAPRWPCRSNALAPVASAIVAIMAGNTPLMTQIKAFSPGACQLVAGNAALQSRRVVPQFGDNKKSEDGHGCAHEPLFR